MERQFYITVDGIQVPVTEEVYRAYMRPVWAERKRRERESRCLDERGKRCAGDCGKCDQQRAGGAFSLDRLVEGGFDVLAQVDVADIIADKLLLEELQAALDELETDERELIDALYYNDRTERDYAVEIGITQQAAWRRKQKVINKLRGIMGTDC